MHLTKLEEIIDNACLQKDINKLIEITNDAKRCNIDSLEKNKQLLYYYYISVAWCGIKESNISLNDIPFHSKEIDNELYYLRKAEQLIDISTPPHLAAPILVNLANLYDHIGRNIEAFALWKKALVYYPNFGMALCNIGKSIDYYSNYTDNSIQPFFLNASMYYLSEALKSETIYNDLVPNIEEIIKKIKSLNIEKINPLKKFIPQNNIEDEYKNWVLSNCLYLNQLNDIYEESSSSLYDTYYLPGIFIEKEEYGKENLYFSIFNQIKQEYVSARYLLYQSLNTWGKHFSDNGNVLIDTLEYHEMSYNIELAKNAFRSLYSIFDKISYFLNCYLNLGIHPSQVKFRTFWFVKNQLNPLILNNKNWALRGLFYLRKDFYYENEEYINAPDAKRMAEIRNFMEHKSFMLCNEDERYYTIENDNFTLTMSRYLFEKKAIYLISLVRAAIFYLGNIVTKEEHYRIRNTENGIIETLPLNEYQDNN